MKNTITLTLFTLFFSINTSAATNAELEKEIVALKYERFQKNQSSRTFAGVQFGIGISVTRDLGGHNRIKSASLDENNKIRVEKDNNQVARVMLESHYFWKIEETAAGHGPFLALQPGTDEIIEAIGFGWMVGFKRPGKGDESLNFGIGYMVDPSVKILGDDLEENEALPEGESQIRYRETSQDGIVFLASFTF